MTMPLFTMRQLLEAGVHFGHQTRRWNPKMGQYLFGERGGIHIIDLQQTVPMLHHALEAVRNVASKGGKVLFVGTKRQAADPVKQAAELCGQYYVNHRWLGGTMTNWQTVSQSISRLKEIEEKLAEPEGFTKKELLNMNREFEKLNRSLGGIREMGGVPSIIVVLDSNMEDIAIKEANKLGLPVVCILDSNSNPDGVDYPIPGNDDASRAIELYCNLFSAAVLAGMQERVSKSGKDLGESADIVMDVQEADVKESIEAEAEEIVEAKA